MEPNWFIDIIRSIIFWFDSIVYWLVDLVYQLFMMIAETGIFRAEDIRIFADRIYFFLGLIMVFKVSISIVQFIANPDSVKDSKIGAPRLLKNLAIILLGIIFVPYVFEAAYSLQRMVLKENIVGNLILGMNNVGNEEPEDFIKSGGKRMAFTSFTAFFHLDSDIVIDEEGTSLFSPNCVANPFLSTGEINTADCSSEAESKLNDFLEKKKNQNYKEAYLSNNINYIRRANYNYTVKDAYDDKQYMFSYTILVSTIAGGFIVWILLGFCVDIAVRNIKLGFLQLIAPIPLIAKIDPKKGEDVFNRWIKQCVSTYFDLFGRLIAIYFAIFLLSLITEGTFNVITEEKETNVFVNVFFIIGILNFAKALPKLLEDIIPGLKLGDGKGLGLKNKLAGTPLVGGAASKALGLAERTGKNLMLGAGKGVLAGIGAGGRHLGGFLRGKAAKAFNDSSMGQWHAQRVLDGVDLGTKMRSLGNRAANRFNKISSGAQKVGDLLNDKTGGAFSAAGEHFGNTFDDIGVDAKSTFSGMGASLKNTLGMLESKKNQILNRQSDGKLEMDNNKTMYSANDAVMDIAKSKLKETEEYARREQSIDTLKKRLDKMISSIPSVPYENFVGPLTEEQQQSRESAEAERTRVEAEIRNLENEIAHETAEFGKWSTKEGVFEFIDGTGAFENRDLGGSLKSAISKRDATAESLGFTDFASGAKAADDAAGRLKGANREIESSFVKDNAEMARIDEQIRKAKDFKSGR